MQTSVNQVKATIDELETDGQEPIDDIGSLVIIYFLFAESSKQTRILAYIWSDVLRNGFQEELAQEDQQKIEVEKHRVQEAKVELDKHQEIAKSLESKYPSVREKIDQLPEDTEPLKVRWSTVLSLCLEAKNSFWFELERLSV